MDVSQNVAPIETNELNLNVVQVDLLYCPEHGPGHYLFGGSLENG
jgi:hypothetical protein